MRNIAIKPLALGLAAIASGAFPAGFAACAQSFPAPYASPPLSVTSAIERWNALRQSDNHSFGTYASFLAANRGWPGEAAMRRAAEKTDTSYSSPADVVAYFRAFPPLTAGGRARFAIALAATGRGDDSRDEARAAWRAGAMSRTDEDRLLAQFSGALDRDDHHARIESLLVSGDALAAARANLYSAPARQSLFATRIALRTRAPDAASRIAALGGSADGDAGFLADRAAWYRSTGQSIAARQSLAGRRALERPPAQAEHWLEILLVMAHAAANDRQWTSAYQIASRLDDAYAPGTDISDRPFAERDHYTSLAWLAGNAALHNLARPRDAERIFLAYAGAARSPQTRAKGRYWAARAAHAAGDVAGSTRHLEAAASAPDQFYGQLAIERLGRRIEAPGSSTAIPTASERGAFRARSLIAAARQLGLMGRHNDQTLFVRAIAEQAKTGSERALAAEFGREIGRADLGVWLAREARNIGETYYARPAFPEVRIPPAYGNLWSLAHGITRQESSFDRAAVSSAGARGMMQLMPGTAREVSGKLGVGYDYGGLTADPGYNVMLGSSYFRTLLDQWGGNNVLAIASYNAGAGNVRRWVREIGDPRAPGADIIRWIEAIPFSETRNYVQRVLENAVVYDTIDPQRQPTRYRLSSWLGKSSPG